MLLALAKINLFLYVVGRDEKGYHILQSLFCLIPSVADRMSIEINYSGKIEVESNEVIRNNLVIKAAQELLKVAGNHNLGIKLKLEKNIPIGAGLGGSSSNAATTLIRLNELLKLNLTTDQLIRISESIGDDVKFFLMQKNCVYFDGDEKYEIKLDRKLNLLLVKPDFSINTEKVYSLFRKQIPTLALKSVVQKDKILEYIFNGENQLYDVTFKVEARICDVISELQNQNGIVTARMTGSGSTCFGIFDSKESSERAMYAIAKKHSKWFIHSCEVII